MAEQSSIHSYLNWTKQRIDEMDATLASLEVKAGQAKAESKTKAEQAIADLKKRRDEFQAAAKQQTQAGEAALQAGRAQLEAQWRAFEGQVKTYFEAAGSQVEQQQAAFQNIVTAQLKAWRAAADTFQSEAAKIAAAHRPHLDAAVKQMKADATEAEGRLQKLKQVGGESWAALSAALTESRRAFDQANQKAADALKGTAANKTTSAA